MWVVGADDAVDLVEPVGDDVGELLVAPDPHHRDEVGVAGDRVDLGHAVDVGDGLAPPRGCGRRRQLIRTMAVITGTP